MNKTYLMLELCMGVSWLRAQRTRPIRSGSAQTSRTLTKLVWPSRGVVVEPAPPPKLLGLPRRGARIGHAPHELHFHGPRLRRGRAPAQQMAPVLVVCETQRAWREKLSRIQCHVVHKNVKGARPECPIETGAPPYTHTHHT